MYDSIFNVNEEDIMPRVKFDEVLHNDVVMSELKLELETLKDSMLELNIKTISRMRELIEASYPADQVLDREDEIPLLVNGLTECLTHELAVRTMDAMLPGWEIKAKEKIVEMAFRELMEATGIDLSKEFN